jgi:hypothetical protein
MATAKTTAKAKTTTAAPAANAKRKKREPRGWYIAKGVKIPLEEYLKDEPEFTGLGRTDMLKKRHPGFGKGEILDMRAVLK